MNFFVIATVGAIILAILSVYRNDEGNDEDYSDRHHEDDSMSTSSLFSDISDFESAISNHSSNKSTFISTPVFTNDTTTLKHDSRRRRLVVRPVRFFAMGDAPYSQVEKENFPLQLAKMDPRADFAVHLGDMQDRRRQCQPAPYNEMADMIKGSKVPMFIVPGDNCYYDCANWQQGFDYWSNAFYNIHQHWKTNYNVRTQPARPENFAITWHRILFVGIHTIWTRKIKSRLEWNRLENDNIDWTKNQLKQFAHSGKVDAVVILAQSFPRKELYRKYNDYLSKEAMQLNPMPFLFLQGDAHRFRQDTPFKAKNILRTIVDRGGIADPVLVTVDMSKAGKNPFIFQRRPLSGK